MWGLYFLGLVAYIPATPVQGYLSLTLRKLGFSVFDSNMLSIPSAALQIILMLILAKSSEFFNERTFHCFFGEFWCLPLLAALLGIPHHGYAWPRFALTTMISGCSSPSLITFKQWCLMLTLWPRPILPPHRLCVDIGEFVQCQETCPDCCDLQRDRANRLGNRVADISSKRRALLLPW